MREYVYILKRVLAFFLPIRIRPILRFPFSVFHLFLKAAFPFLLFIFLTGYSSGQKIFISIPLENKCSKESISDWNTIVNYYYGVAGTGFIGENERIGFCEAKYQWGGPWRPIDGFKQTLCGNMFIKKRKNILRKSTNNNYHLFSDGDGDMVFYIKPDSSFRWLLYKSLRPQGHYFKDYTLSCEVSLKESGKTTETNARLFFQNMPLDSIQNKPVGVYGPWVSDVHHENSPEIHPIQQMWSIDQLQNDIIEYHLYSYFDNSGRFNNNNNFSDSCYINSWVTTPLVNYFYIPFSISLKDTFQLVYDIEMTSSNKINLYNSIDGKLELIVNGNVRLIVKKPINEFPFVSLFDVCQIDEETIHGYIKVETSIGMADSKSGAHSILKMLLSKRY